MKRLILILPFVLMACGESTSEMMERKHKILKDSLDKESALNDSKLKELQDKMEADSITLGINKH